MRQLLVIDDEAHIARVIQVTFEREGWGWGFLEKLTNGDEALDTPVVVLTGAEFAGMRQTVVDLGGTYVAKPFSPSKLRTMVDDILNQSDKTT